VAVSEMKLRKGLRELTDHVQAYLVLVDQEYKKQESVERGKRLADLANKLQLKNDLVRRYTLELDWNGKKLNWK
jgi:hypothetical protein